MRIADSFADFSVNFRGSVGFGQASVNSLPGKVGTQDVGDVQVRCFSFFFFFFFHFKLLLWKLSNVEFQLKLEK